MIEETMGKEYNLSINTNKTKLMVCCGKEMAWTNTTLKDTAYKEVKKN